MQIRVRTLESPLDCKEIQLVHPKGNQSWIFIRRTDAEAETPILGPPDAKSWPIWKDPDAGKDWGQEEKGTTEDEMTGWHHRLDGHGFGWTPGVGDGQGGLVCCGSWGCKESDMTEQLNWTELKMQISSMNSEGILSDDVYPMTSSTLVSWQSSTFTLHRPSHTHLADQKVGQVIESFFIGICKQTQSKHDLELHPRILMAYLSWLGK